MAKKPEITAHPEDRQEPASSPWDARANIHLRMLRARQEYLIDIQPKKFVQKGALRSDPEESYEAFSIHDLSDQVDTALAKHGARFHLRVDKWHKQGNAALIEATGIFTNVDEPADVVLVTTVAEGYDRSDKAFGKATSYARKNAMIQGLNLSLGINNEIDRNLNDALADGTTPPAQQGAFEPPQPAPPPTAAPAGVPPVLHPLSFNGYPVTVAAGDMVMRVAEHVSKLTAERDLRIWEAQNKANFESLYEINPELMMLVVKIIDGRLEALTQKVAA